MDDSVDQVTAGLDTLHMPPMDGTPLPSTGPTPYGTDLYTTPIMTTAMATPHAVSVPISPANMMGWNPALTTVPVVMAMPSTPTHMQMAPAYGGYAPSTPTAMPADYSAMGMGTMSPAAPGMVPVGRTVYVGNIPSDAAVNELLDLVHFGPIENVRLLPEKNCEFISFLTGQVAAAFHADSSVKHVSLHNQELKIGWGKPSVPPPAVVYAVQHQQASRNVYIGQLEENETESTLRDKLIRFGPIDQVKIVREQNIGFAHFLSIQTAMKVVSVLQNDPAWSQHRINYGKDRCAYVPKGQQQIQAHNHQAAAMGLATATWLGYPTGYVNYNQAPFFRNEEADSNDTDSSSRSQTQSLGNVEPQLHQFGNRTVYLGNLHPDTTAEDICNHVRGGILQAIRYMPDRHIAFVTFVDHNAALTFYHMALVTGITVHNRRLKVGWGKHTGPLSPGLALAVQAGASRNVYIGNINDPALMDEEKIRADLSEYGELEMVNTLPERNCAFANFTNIQSAIKCIEGLKYNKDYQSVKISFGKDRCGNPPRYLGKLALNRNHQGPPSAQDSSSSERRESSELSNGHAENSE